MFKNLLVFWIMTDMAVSAEIVNCPPFEEKHFYGQFISQIHLEKSPGIKYNWDWIKGTSNITLVHTNNIEITNSTANDTLKLALKTAGDVSSEIRNTQGSIGLVHLTIPIEYVDSLCVNQEKCFPVKCPLALGSTFSTYPANNKLLFTGNFCELKKPDRWDEWVQYYFKTNISTESFYFLDNDNDGLVNFIEYYGGVYLFNTTNDSAGQQKRPLINIFNDGTDPMNPDSDGDLLLDGFELSNGMSPKQADDVNADTDADGLTNLKEQIYGTDPLNRDTDGDGVEDGTEVANNADPNDPLDQGQTSPNQSFAMVKLTIGDYSCNHSERYHMTVGDIKHQSPDYGKVGSGVYKYLPGNYTITITHIDSNLQYPDFDYLGQVEKESGDATVQVVDPNGILGYHNESVWDFTLGKIATMIVKGENRFDCAKFTTCEECRRVDKCAWRKVTKSCVNKIFKWFKWFSNTCPCEECRSWYGKEVNELRETKWLDKLNKEFKCPCEATLGKFGMKEVDNPSNKQWYPDPSCTTPKSKGCAKYHPGAAGCLRSVGHTDDDAGQQCCYGKNGKLLRAGSLGAGTPDRQYGGITNFYDHYIADVVPFNKCCMECEIASYCNFYVNGVRKGDDTHCPK